MSLSAAAPPRWVRQVVLLTFGYFVATGVGGFLAPQALLHFLGAMAIGAEWIVQLAAILTFIFGLLFPFAAFRPYEYWPILLVAFLGQLAVPAFVLHLALAGIVAKGAASCMMVLDLLFAIALGGVLRHIRETVIGQRTTPSPPPIGQ